MLLPKRILCPVDLSGQERGALGVAVELAQRVGAELFLLHAVDFPHESVALERYYLEIEEEADRRLDVLVKEQVPTQVVAHTVVRRGTVYEQILSFLEEQNADLVVMDTGSRSAFERILVGGITERVARLSPCPVLTVAGKVEPMAGRCVVVALDFSACSDMALDLGVAFAGALGSPVTLLHVVTLGQRNPTAQRFPSVALPTGAVQRQVQSAGEDLRDRTERARAAPVTVSTQLLQGSEPSIEIAAFAQRARAALVVVASRGHGTVGRALLGSTSEKLVRACKVPVLLAPTPRHGVGT